MSAPQYHEESGVVTVEHHATPVKYREKPSGVEIVPPQPTTTTTTEEKEDPETVSSEE